MKKSFLFSGLSQFFKNFSNLIILVYFAKILTLYDFGVFSYGLTIANIFVILFDYGYNYKLTKDMAQNENDFEVLMQKAFKMKILLSIFGLFVFFLLCYLGAWEEEYFPILSLLILSSIFFSFANDLNTPFRVLNQFHFETIHYLIYSAILITISLLSLFYYGDIVTLAFSFLIARFLFFLVSYINVIRYVKINVFSNIFKKINFLNEIKEGFPYAIQIGTSVFMVSIDTLILEMYSTPEEVGIYQAGIKMVIAATFFISVIQNVLLPIFSVKIVKDKLDFIVLHKRYTTYCVLLGIIISLTIYVFRNQIISILFDEKFYKLGEFIIGFSILILLRYFALTFGLVLTVSGNQSKRLKSTVTGNLTLAIIGFILIPIYGIWGCLAASLLAHLIMYGMYFVYSKKEIAHV
jgi:O-antigen/teichoic acid export membrane protein